MMQHSTIQSLPLALKLLWREWRGGELRLLSLALIIAVSASCAVGFFTDRVEQALQRQAIAFLGADLVMRAARPTSLDMQSQAESLGLAFGQQLSFPSMLINGDAMQLASVKVVDEQYPMKGSVKIGSNTETIDSVNRPPQPGTIWLEPRLLNALNASIGDTVQLGESQFTVTSLIINEPDRGGGFFNLSPRAMIHLNDLAATDVIQPGSRVRYRYLFNGEEDSLATMKSWLTPKLQPGERFEEIDRENRRVSTTLNRAKTYLNLAGLLAVIMAGVAVAMAARQYSQRHYDSAALFRCIGQQQKQILSLFAWQLTIVGVLASAAGVAIGWFGQYGLIHLLAGLIPGELPPASWQPAAIGFCSGLLVLFAAAFPAIVRLSEVAPLRVLRRDLSPLPKSAWMIYGLFGAIVVLLLYLYTQDLKLTLLISLGATSITLALTGLAWLFLRLLPRSKGPLVWRLAIANLYRHPKDTLAQLLAFGLTLAAMVLILIVRNDLLDRWESQLPAEAPNNFLINIQPHQVEPLAAFLASRNVNHSGIYPMVRGRLSQINEVPANEFIGPESEGRRATRRELNLTYSTELAEDNRILEGQWWQPEDKGKQLISIEQEFAEDVGLKLGDRLTFSFGAQDVTASVASIRSLDWGSLRPNFFVIFQPGNLDGLPANFITSFYVPEEQTAVLSELIQRFPTLTLLQITPLINDLRSIIAQVTTAVEYVLLFVLAAGILVISSALASSLQERLREGALLRALGGRTSMLRSMLISEFAMIGALAGCLAMLVDEAVSFALFTLVFDLPYQPSYGLWLLVPLAGAALVTLAGMMSAHKVISESPLTIFRQLG